jgi:probable rRNA maturation factor
MERLEQKVWPVEAHLDGEIVYAATMQAICEMVLAEEGATRPCYLSLSIVDDEEIRSYNAEWRGIDAVTDVISLECERPDDPDLAPGEPCELGDIVLAPAYIANQAQGFGTTPADETRLLLIHGLLHLLGYDHLDDEEAQEMEAREDELLDLVRTDAPISHVTLTRHREGDDA